MQNEAWGAKLEKGEGSRGQAVRAPAFARASARQALQVVR